MTSLQIIVVIVVTLVTVGYGFNVPSVFGEAQISHSGPTNSLYGHEKFYDEPHSEHDRVKRGMYFPHFQQNWKQQQWPDLLVSSEPPTEYLKMWITSEHNRYRQLVPATNMRMLYWSEELAASAQRHANRCDFRHSRDRINVGENIWAAPYANYSDAITRWFQEVNNPRCGCNHAYKHCCGHYIQVVWAQTNLVGCGFARCRDVWGLVGYGHHNVFVCHYNPQGNTVFVNGNGQLYAVPAFNWASDFKPRCSECPPDAPACYEGLCYKPTLQEVAAGKQDQSSDKHQSSDKQSPNERRNEDSESLDNNNNGSSNKQMSNKSFKEDSYKGNSNDIRRR